MQVLKIHPSNRVDFLIEREVRILLDWRHYIDARERHAKEC
ncbi:MAG: hypothetical protein RJA35_589 [Actinomycetota bacterium]|jgi:hypothetical protein